MGGEGSCSVDVIKYGRGAVRSYEGQGYLWFHFLCILSRSARVKDEESRMKSQGSEIHISHQH